MKTNIKEFAKQLNNYDSFAIFCHYRPDGDTLGSGLALKLGLEKLGKRAEVFCDDEIPSKFDFLEEVKEVKREFFGEYQAFVAVDSAEIGRIGNYAEIFSKKKETFLLDHHISSTKYANVNVVIDNAANCENVYELLKELGVEFDKNIATILMMGLMTDTGNFAHSNVTENTFSVAKELMQYGVEINKINFNMFKRQSKERAHLFGLTMEKIRFFLDGKLAIITVSKENIVSSKAKSSDTEGFIDFVMGIEGVEVGICLLEMKKENYKASFRTKKSDANAIAGVYGGGGHVKASGAIINGLYEEVIEKLTYTVSQYIED
ncbi:MAG: bifunctional oligoribonuclease/PAP phosphatase NrnA [Clostridiales bacterium]|nr:bifunctional oligoribonuclease/PAP phosphatase NrnA [Clostridiales bacterium]